ncbi:MAG TPA: hypothetical protein VIM41_13500 [Gammaproteobacteria bacterium]
MQKFKRNFNCLAVLALVVGLSACSSGDESPPPPQSAAISATNAQALSIAATDASIEASVNQAANPFGVSIAVDSTTVAVSQQIANMFQQQRSPIGAVVLTGDCGGSVEGPDDQTATSGVMSFNNYCTNVPGYGNMTMNGNVAFSFRDPVLSLNYNNVQVSFGGQTETLNMSLTVNLDTGDVSWSSSFAGTGGQQLTISNFEITGTPSSGINIISGRVTHPSFGYIDITTSSPVVLTGCENNRPMSGTIVAQGSGGTSASITFNGCNSYTWCYDLGNGSGPQCNSGTW